MFVCVDQNKFVDHLEVCLMRSCVLCEETSLSFNNLSSLDLKPRPYSGFRTYVTPFRAWKSDNTWVVDFSS